MNKIRIEHVRYDGTDILTGNYKGREVLIPLPDWAHDEMFEATWNITIEADKVVFL